MLLNQNWVNEVTKMEIKNTWKLNVNEYTKYQSP